MEEKLHVQCMNLQVLASFILKDMLELHPVLVSHGFKAKKETMFGDDFLCYDMLLWSHIPFVGFQHFIYFLVSQVEIQSI